MNISQGTLQIPWLNSRWDSREYVLMEADLWAALQPLAETAVLYKAGYGTSRA